MAGLTKKEQDVMAKALRRSAEVVQGVTVAPDTGAAASGVMGPVVTPEQVTALMRFAAACMEPWPECLSDYDGEMQGRLLAAGLIQPKVTPPYDQWEFDEQYADCEPGDECYFKSEFAGRCLAARSAPAVPTGVATTPQGETCAVCGGSGALPLPVIYRACPECRSTTREIGK